MDGPARDRVMKLIEEKDRIESVIRDLNTILEVNNVGMQTILMDSDGYPTRNDIDVFKMMYTRNHLKHLENDHKKIMKEIEKGLGEVHADLGASGSLSSAPPPPTCTNDFSSQNEVYNHNFAKVGSVQDGSPADLAGLCKDDELLQSGSLNHKNFTDVTQIHNIVQRSVSQPVQVRVQRERGCSV